MDYKDHKNQKGRNFWHQARAEFIDYLLAGHHKPGAPILDIGSGTGSLIPALKKHGPVTALDRSPEAVAAARADRIDIIKADIGGFPVSEGAWDSITMFDVLEHIENDRGTLKKAAKGLKPGGALIITVPAYNWLFSFHDQFLGHCRRYNRRQIKKLLEESGLLVIESGYWNCLLFPLEAAFRLAKKAVFALGLKTDFKPENTDYPKLADRLLLGALRLDLKIKKIGLSLPGGLTVYAIARKKTD